jgi:hypothetical protein
MRGVMVLGAVLVIARLIAFAYSTFTSSDTSEVAKLGDFKVQAREQTAHVIPPIISAGLLVGASLIRAGAFPRR